MLHLYHRNCKGTHTSKLNLFFQAKQSERLIVGPSETQPRKLGGEDTAGFNIRRHCSICGTSRKRCSNKSRENLTHISPDTGQSTPEKVLDVAVSRHDDAIRWCMLFYPDLFAFDAKHHRSCYSHYKYRNISKRNIQAVSVTAQQEPDISIFEKAFHKLAEDIAQTVLSKEL